MKSMIFVALALVAVAAAAPVEEPEATVRSEFNRDPDGSYIYAYETAKGIFQQQIGELKEVFDEDNKPHTVVVARGSYSYPGDDGEPISISYTADQFGYRALGDTIPQVPVARR